MTASDILLLIITGIFSGFINTVASSGSAITLPVTILMGLDPLIANGTNRMPVAIGFLTSVIKFQHSQKINWKSASIMAIPVLLGTMVGSLLIQSIPTEYSHYVLFIALVISFILVRSKAHHFLKEENIPIKKIKFQNIIVLFLIGIWAGLIVLDSALFLLLTLVILLKYDLIQANVMKCFLALIIGVVSLVFFGINGHVNWTFGIILSLGSIIGAYIGSNFSLRPNAKVWIFRIIQAIILIEFVLLTMKLFSKQ